MFDTKKILEIARQSKQEKWPYPKTFQALKDAGVEFYEVDVATHQLIYFGDGLSVQEEKSAHFQTLSVADRWEPQAVQIAIKNNQTKKTNYDEFLQEIALAGVHHYRVEMNKRLIIYYGKRPKEEYAENIPVFK